MKTYLPVAPGARQGFSHTRPVYVIDDLADLHGPTSDLVTLPIHIDWTPASTYDLSNPTRLRSMYAVVLRGAGSEAEVAEWLDPRLLLQHWAELNLPTFVRDTWEAVHPTLRNPDPWR